MIMKIVSWAVDRLSLLGYGLGSSRQLNSTKRKTKMKFTHTPGPWHVTQDSEGTLDVNHSTETIRSRICRSHVEYLAEEHGGCVNGNVRLIAAAPELLNALKDAEFLLRKAGQIKGPMQDSFIRSSADAKAAIARAEGGAA
jgi:hypothetical protein